MVALPTSNLVSHAGTQILILHAFRRNQPQLTDRMDRIDRVEYSGACCLVSTSCPWIFKAAKGKQTRPIASNQHVESININRPSCTHCL